MPIWNARWWIESWWQNTTNKTVNPKPNWNLKPGEIRELTEWPLCLRFGKDIEPGDYVFVPREENIETPDKQVFTLESNLLQELGSPLFSVE
jgi:hypothetical protein